ncbi:MAG: isochorismatase family cysteine hydrolase [Lagierella massiliensis]|nr:isochorismatase family cysteine hydrolase [Lagierella massiliensis]
MKDVLVVVDMQNDFVNGSLGTDEAKEIVPKVKKFIKSFNGQIYFTRDTHEENYLETQEGSILPVKHCIKNTKGWEIIDELKPFVSDNVVDKVTFGSKELVKVLENFNEKDEIKTITIIGLCTDICVISNALVLKAYFPEVKIKVFDGLCAGVSPESHDRALESMKTCQIHVE